MLENPFNLVKQQAGDAIIDNPAIPGRHNEEAGNSIVGTLKHALSGNQIDSIFYSWSV